VLVDTVKKGYFK